MRRATAVHLVPSQSRRRVTTVLWCRALMCGIMVTSTRRANPLHSQIKCHCHGIAKQPTFIRAAVKYLCPLLQLPYVVHRSHAFHQYGRILVSQSRICRSRDTSTLLPSPWRRTKPAANRQLAFRSGKSVRPIASMSQMRSLM